MKQANKIKKQIEKLLLTIRYILKQQKQQQQQHTATIEKTTTSINSLKNTGSSMLSVYAAKQ